MANKDDMGTLNKLRQSRRATSKDSSDSKYSKDEFDDLTASEKGSDTEDSRLNQRSSRKPQNINTRQNNEARTLGSRQTKLGQKTCRDNSGDDNSGDDNSGDDNSGDDNSGDDNSDDDNSGDDNSGDNNIDDDNSGGDNSGDDNSGNGSSGNGSSGGDTGDSHDDSSSDSGADGKNFSNFDTNQPHTKKHHNQRKSGVNSLRQHNQTTSAMVTYPLQPALSCQNDVTVSFCNQPTFLRPSQPQLANSKLAQEIQFAQTIQNLEEMVIDAPGNAASLSALLFESMLPNFRGLKYTEPQTTPVFVTEMVDEKKTRAEDSDFSTGGETVSPLAPLDTLSGSERRTVPAERQRPPDRKSRKDAPKSSQNQRKKPERPNKQNADDQPTLYVSKSLPSSTLKTQPELFCHPHQKTSGSRETAESTLLAARLKHLQELERESMEQQSSCSTTSESDSSCLSSTPPVNDTVHKKPDKRKLEVAATQKRVTKPAAKIDRRRRTSSPVECTKVSSNDRSVKPCTRRVGTTNPDSDDHSENAPNLSSPSLSRVEMVVQNEVKLRRLKQLRDIFNASPYFDMEDIDTVNQEITQTEHAVAGLLVPLSDAQQHFLRMQVTVKHREIIIEKAVANNLLNHEEDRLFTTLVDKQVHLLKLVHNREKPS